MYNIEDEDNSTGMRHERYHIPESKTRRTIQTIMGIVMVIIYVGMGILLLINFFGWEGNWAWTRYLVGVILIIYGFWRAYRQYAGIDSRI